MVLKNDYINHVVDIYTSDSGVIKLRFNWVTFSYRYKTTDTYFGTSFYTLDSIQDFAHHVLRAAQADALGGLDQWPVDQDRVRDHRVEHSSSVTSGR